MFLRFVAGLFLAISVVKSVPALAQSNDREIQSDFTSEESRHKGFYEHQQDNKDFDRERNAGLKAYLKEQAEWEEQRKKDRGADKGRKKQESPLEGGPEYKADRKEKYEDYLDYEKDRKAYMKEKKSFEAKNEKEQAKRNAWAMEEYGLDKETPRFDIAKRNFKDGKGSTGTSSSSAGRSSGGGSGNFSPNFPPPPSFDDDGYVPPPFPPAPAESFEPPQESFPAPPPMPMGDPGADFDGGYFPPPPPPIPAPDDGF